MPFLRLINDRGAFVDYPQTLPRFKLPGHRDPFADAIP